MKYDFKMSGGMGDIIFALPTVRALGGGALCLCPSRYTFGRFESGNVFMQRAQAFESLSCFITSACSYVTACDVSETEVEAKYDLNSFREQPGLAGPRTIPRIILDHFGCNPHDVNHSWLDLGPLPPGRRVVINRTERYRNPAFPWHEVMAKYPDKYFVGTSRELIDFRMQFGWITQHFTSTVTEMARVIASSELYIGNQSLGYALAEGFKQRAVLETDPTTCNHNFERQTVIIDPTPDQLPDL